MMLKLLLTFFYLVTIAHYVHPQLYTRILTLPATSLQEEIITPQSVFYVSTPPPRRPIRNRKKRPKPVVEQYLKEVTPTTKTIFSESTTQLDDRIISQEDPSYYRQRHTSVALPAIVVPREYLSYFAVKPPEVEEYENVRSSNRKTNPYLPSSSRFREIDPVKELLWHRQNMDGRVVSGGGREDEKTRSERGKSEEDAVSHILGYFSVSHKGIVPMERNAKK